MYVYCVYVQMYCHVYPTSSSDMTDYRSMEASDWSVALSCDVASGVM